jgi:hypothetical protein
VRGTDTIDELATHVIGLGDRTLLVTDGVVDGRRLLGPERARGDTDVVSLRISRQGRGAGDVCTAVSRTSKSSGR